MNPEPVLSDEQRKAMDEWNKGQDQANAVLPGSVLKVPEELKPKRQTFCPPTHAAKSAEALEKREND